VKSEIDVGVKDKGDIDVDGKSIHYPNLKVILMLKQKLPKSKVMLKLMLMLKQKKPKSKVMLTFKLMPKQKHQQLMVMLVLIPKNPKLVVMMT